MQTDLLDLYRRGSEWCGKKVAGATALDAPTSCDGWTVRDLLNHMLETQHYFAGSARGEDVSPPGPNPPKLLTQDPVDDFASARADVLQAFGQDGAEFNLFNTDRQLAALETAVGDGTAATPIAGCSPRSMARRASSRKATRISSISSHPASLIAVINSCRVSAQVRTRHRNTNH
jgi:hypothetical protein